eukprot:TRINITY_DN357_c2_g1_i1.p1 TRINITY_DN357_c2_g1~~TRINITY_DN357_c2_g1_i1.p1  ORF type:complete len:115 (+),score=40.32 TRINITY_DN357_c2_g1_i1:65-409(+)
MLKFAATLGKSQTITNSIYFKNNSFNNNSLNLTQCLNFSSNFKKAKPTPKINLQIFFLCRAFLRKRHTLKLTDKKYYGQLILQIFRGYKNINDPEKIERLIKKAKIVLKINNVI